MIVPRRLTPIDVRLVLPALDAAHHSVFVRQASVDTLALAAAQLSEEHGESVVAGVTYLHGVWNDELGNADVGPGAATDPNVLAFSTVPEREVAADGSEYKHVHMRAAYASIGDGAVGYWRFWQSPKWAASFDALESGDAEAFALALKTAHYYTGSESDYARALVRLQPVWRARWEGT
jgi:hypothetical protein